MPKGDVVEETKVTLRKKIIQAINQIPVIRDKYPFVFQETLVDSLSKKFETFELSNANEFNSLLINILNHIAENPYTGSILESSINFFKKYLEERFEILNTRHDEIATAIARKELLSILQSNVGKIFKEGQEESSLLDAAIRFISPIQYSSKLFSDKELAYIAYVRSITLSDTKTANITQTLFDLALKKNLLNEIPELNYSNYQEEREKFFEKKETPYKTYHEKYKNLSEKLIENAEMQLKPRQLALIEKYKSDLIGILRNQVIKDLSQYKITQRKYGNKEFNYYYYNNHDEDEKIPAHSPEGFADIFINNLEKFQLEENGKKFKPEYSEYDEHGELKKKHELCRAAYIGKFFGLLPNEHDIVGKKIPDSGPDPDPETVKNNLTIANLLLINKSEKSSQTAFTLKKYQAVCALESKIRDENVDNKSIAEHFYQETKPILEKDAKLIDKKFVADFAKTIAIIALTGGFGAAYLAYKSYKNTGSACFWQSESKRQATQLEHQIFRNNNKVPEHNRSR